ncbi:hypothetical protein J4050_14270 [Winogradskyella sp. DF17]|uniref:Uncharacterized protein n=1 Tax=Winogradskyella pelagia TaxID=2819984 RepID=A0ABS3T585_9FLAO|nr:hypothetical protein [Winogradskyella sp. DF17]MBO3117918.1 hypothetical protein [Winogradskyella sp. DF17]
MRVFILIILLCFSSLVLAQKDGFNFPEDAFGIYKGDLIIENDKGKQTIGMEFHFQPTEVIGTYQYKIVYIADAKRQERNYNLIVKDSTLGQYIIDENNGIRLPAKQFGHRIHSIFEVQGNLLITTEAFYDDYMLFEIVFSNTNEEVVSGNTSEDIPKVTAYPVTVSQRAKLFKVKN